MTETNPLNTQLETTDITWNLEDLYSSTDAPEINSDIKWCESEAVAIREEYYQKMDSLAPKDFLNLVTRIEALDCKVSQLATYSFLNFTTQMGNAEAGALDQRIREVDAQCGTETVFFELEWNNLSDEKAAALLNNAALDKYHHYLSSLRKHRPHQLSETAERILFEKEISGRRSWTTLFNKVLSSYRFGEQQRTEEEVLTDLYSETREIRRAAADELTDGLRANSHILTHIFNTLAADKMVMDKLRNHTSWVSSMNLENELI